ncbi:glycosyltransferase family 2 protein [Sphingobacterium corticibacter]|uniref:Glycosyltransferase family 2 protein n=1 Tax=Sphingobacterium corticibacter TaxID=2171749 RepID=A0A2T8HJL3_9SPHI|nr:glycosyltransferase family 2 protein [Sphingobacterium corticibacter]PVH25583.1 glycosyltransferase family 2 protein [Sphingobacterium corticibacter]
MVFSIIIPHKNATQLLQRLLESIPQRIDLEVIVVDDNSDVQEIANLEKLQAGYAFSLYHNKGKRGAGASRNVGLEHARGKYVLLADSDDFFNKGFHDELDRVAKKEIDVFYYKVYSADSDTYEESHRHLFFNDLIDAHQQKGKRDVLYKYSVPWGKIYRRQFIEDHHIRFAEVIAGNDMWFSCRCGVLAKTFEISDFVLYTVTIRDGSIVNTIKPEYFLARFDETIRVNNMLRQSKLSAYQYSVLYFVSKAHQFGVKSYIAKEILRNRSNIFIGLEKIFDYKKVMIDRENKRKSKN